MNVNEGSTATFRVKLSRVPSGDVTVSVTSNDTNEATVSPQSLTFTRTNWDTYQTVTVEGVHDTDPTNENTTISLVSSGGGYTDTAGVAVTVFDDDTRGVRSSANSVSMGAGDNRDINVRLLTMPTGTVTVAVASADTTTATVNKELPDLHHDELERRSDCPNQCAVYCGWIDDSDPESIWCGLRERCDSFQSG